MRTLAKWMAFGAFAALVVAIGPAARAEDDIAIFHVPVPMNVGHAVLDPGVYEFRALHDSPDHRLIRLTRVGEVKAAAYILAGVRQPLVGEATENTNYLFLKGSEPARLVKWDVTQMSATYVFPAFASTHEVVAGAGIVLASAAPVR